MVTREKVSTANRASSRSGSVKEGRQKPSRTPSKDIQQAPGSPRKLSRKKALYKPSRVTVEYYDNNKDSASNQGGPEKRSDNPSSRRSVNSKSKGQDIIKSSSQRVPPPVVSAISGYKSTAKGRGEVISASSTRMPPPPSPGSTRSRSKSSAQPTASKSDRPPKISNSQTALRSPSSARIPPPPSSMPSRRRSKSPAVVAKSSPRTTSSARSFRSPFSFVTRKKKEKEPLLVMEEKPKTHVGKRVDQKNPERAPTYIPPVVEPATEKKRKHENEFTSKKRKELAEQKLIANSDSMDGEIKDRYQTTKPQASCAQSSKGDQEAQLGPEHQQEAPPPLNDLNAVLADSNVTGTDGTRTFTTGTYAGDTFEDETFEDETFSMGSDTANGKRAYSHYARFTKSLSEYSSYADITVEIKQQVAWGCIILTAIQFALLTSQSLLCGFAKFTINPTIGPYPDAFSEWGGKNAYLLVEEGQYFRLFTPVLLHVGYLHFLVNAFFQLETCAYYEREWGFLKWIFLYIMSGLGSSLAAAAVDPDIIAVCSSGALMGLFGARIAQAIVWAGFETRDKYTEQGSIIFERLGGTVCSASVVFFLTFLTYIDWSGHFGGFCTGFLLGLVTFSYAVKKASIRVIIRFLGLSGLVIGSLVLGVVLFNYAETDPDMADACDYFRNLYSEGYKCECQAFD